MAANVSDRQRIGRPIDPLQVLTRATTHLRVAKQGLQDMAELDQERVVLGFFGVAVFGRSVTLALQMLRRFDAPAFDAWYAPWQQEMKDDELCRFFSSLRTGILHNLDPLIGFVLASSGATAPRPGAIIVQDRPPPTMHRGKPIEDVSMLHLCSLYVAYLDELVDSASSVILMLQDRPSRQGSAG